MVLEVCTDSLLSSERVSIQYSAREHDPVYKTHTQLFLCNVTKYSLNDASADLVDCKPQGEQTCMFGYKPVRP